MTGILKPPLVKLVRNLQRGDVINQDGAWVTVRYTKSWGPNMIWVSICGGHGGFYASPDLEVQVLP